MAVGVHKSTLEVLTCLSESDGAGEGGQALGEKCKLLMENLKQLDLVVK